MRLTFWRCRPPATPTPLPQRTPNTCAEPPAPRQTPDGPSARATPPGDRPTSATDPWQTPDEPGRSPNDRPLWATASRQTPDEPSVRTSPPGQSPDDRPAWATAPTEVFPMNGPGRPGGLTRAQEWRANGGRWLPSRGGTEAG